MCEDFNMIEMAHDKDEALLVRWKMRGMPSHVQ